MSEWPSVGIADLEEEGIIQLGRGKVISKKDLAAMPGTYPVYSSAKENDGKFGEYGHFMFDEELITWSVDGGGSLFHRPKHRFSITNVGGFIRILDKQAVECRYLYFVLSWLHSQVRFDWVRKAHPSVIRTVYTSFPLPPLEEQKRIVAVLDQAFAALDRARALAETNLADAKEVLSRKLDELFYPAHSARMKTIGEVASIQSGAGFPEKEQGLGAGDYPFYKVSDMNLSGNERYLSTANNYINELVRKRLRASIFPKGSIVFPKVGGAIATNKKRVVEAEGCADNNVMGLIPDEHVVLPEYLHEWLFATDIYEFSNKANPPSITKGTVKEWPFFCPDLERQAQIVRLVQTMRGGIKAINEHYSQIIADLGELRHSFFQKAFAGELT